LDRGRKVPADDETAITVLLKEKEAGGPLDIRHGLRGCLLEKIKPFAAHDRKPQIPNQLLVMLLANSEEVENIFAQVIQELHLGRLFMEEDLCASAEWLTVTGVFRNQGNDLAGDAVLATQIR
jgi:hypothetical protein